MCYYYQYSKNKILPVILYAACLCITIPTCADTLYLEKEYIVSATTFGKDTVYRSYSYTSRGFLSAVVDSPLYHDLYPAYRAKCDSIGRIVSVETYRKVRQSISSYTWVNDRTIAFCIRDTGNVLLDTGTFVIGGPLHGVRFPQQEPMLPTIQEKKRMVFVADSTKVFDRNGVLFTMYSWKFDRNGTDTAWYYQLPGNNKTEWVNSYTNGYSSGGILFKRFPALEGPSSYYYYTDHPVAVSQYKSYRNYIKNPLYSSTGENVQYCLDGRRVPDLYNIPVKNRCHIERKKKKIHIE